MHNRVEITGINTADLRTLSNERMMELIELSHKGDDAARDELVYGNLLLILSVIKKFRNRGEAADDLFQVGCIGLLKAIDNFDLTRGVRFSTYAVPMIIGEIRRYLRDNSSIRVSRSLKDIAYKSLAFKERFIKEHHREPTVEEMAANLEVETIDIIVSLEAIQEPISIFTPIYSNNGDEIYLIDQITDDENSEEQKIFELTIKEGFKKLSERERNILIDRYFNGKTQMEIAEEIGISQAQVSRLEKNALDIIYDKEN